MGLDFKCQNFTQNNPLPQCLVEWHEQDVTVREAFRTSTGDLEWEALPFTAN